MEERKEKIGPGKEDKGKEEWENWKGKRVRNGNVMKWGHI